MALSGILDYIPWNFLIFLAVIAAIVFIIKLYLFTPRKHKYWNPYRRNRGGPYRTKPATDLSRWRLTNTWGRHVWDYYPPGTTPPREQRPLDKYYLGMDTSDCFPVLPRAKTAKQACYNAMKFFFAIQAEDGHWGGDYGSTLFLLPQMVFSYYITGSEFPPGYAAEIVRHLRSVECPDGGWPLHVEAPPMVHTTSLNYMVMRILGVPRDDPVLQRARKILIEMGGAEQAPLWSKFWLAVLNVYKWDGFPNVCPEMWIMPNWVPIHPGRFWVFCRTGHMAMCYIYGVKYQVPENDLNREFRKDLFRGKWEDIYWPSLQTTVAPTDIFRPPSPLLKLLYMFTGWMERHQPESWRTKALDKLYQMICVDDTYTKCITVGPITKVIHPMIHWIRDGPKNKFFIDHRERDKDYLWVGRDGMKMQAVDGCQLWDMTFAIQCLVECGSQNYKEFHNNLDMAHKWLLYTQIKENPPDHMSHWRQNQKGAFPLSTKDNGWMVTDCSAEGLTAIMMLEDNCNFLTEKCREDLKFANVHACLLVTQNPEDGVSSYETRRGGEWLEVLNPAAIFDKLVIDYCHMECTGSVMRGLAYFSERYPQHRAEEIKSWLPKGLEFIRKKLRPDGTWYGFWGVCFTYGAWFGLEAYALMGYSYDKGNLPIEVKKCVKWLEDHQLPDGGWGENFETFESGEYMPADESQMTQTAWALLALCSVKYPNLAVLERAIKLLIDTQLDNGDWELQNIMGCFNVSSSLHYENYNKVFPMWALGRFSNTYPESALAK